MRSGWTGLGLGAWLLLGGGNAAARDCASLVATPLRDASVTGAGLLPAGSTPANPKFDVCAVKITARPSAYSDVRIELWIPDARSWNGKFLQVGNGGFAGKIPYRLMTLGLAQGYAVAGTDDGHQSEDATDASWALGHPEKLVDFGWRGVKATTDASKAVLAAYGPAPRKAYFFGCSDGGREALMTAQRFPDDFDGIVAGAPAYDWTSLQAAAALFQQRVGASALPAAKLPAIQAAALRACGGGNYVRAPDSCRFDPVVLACKRKAKVSNQCLTPREVGAVRNIYNGMTNPATGRHLPGLHPGAEAQPGSWDNWLLGRNNGAGQGAGTNERPTGFAGNWFAYAVKGDATYRVENATRGDYAASEALAGTVSALDPDLGRFRARGGKLLMYHGWNDPAISPDYSIAYARALKARMGDIGAFQRLYLVPGMLHCTGGASPNQVDWLGTLDGWVERGSAPGTIVATGPNGTSQDLNPR